jgi:superoxide dismutase, Fe-Mn family
MAFEMIPLPYAYDALEPYIDAQTVELHYSKHHRPTLTI